jgi:hypothetical protein
VSRNADCDSWAVPLAATTSVVASAGADRSPSVSTDCWAARAYTGASTAAVVATSARRNTTSERPARYLIPRSMTVQAVNAFHPLHP